MLNANELLKKGIAQVKAAGIVPGNINPIVKVNHKKIQRFGLCSYKSRGQYRYEIEINVILLESNNEMSAMNTMVHEILHTCEGCMNHGPKWKSYARIMNNKYGYNIKTTSTYAERGIEQPKGKYSVICKNKSCGTRYEKNRMSNIIRNPHQYTCGKCKGELEVIYNESVTNYQAANTAVDVKPSTRKSSTRPTGRTSETKSKGTSSLGTTTKAKYVIQCTKCKKEYGRNRMSKAVKNVSAYRCRCGGSLKLL